MEVLLTAGVHVMRWAAAPELLRRLFTQSSARVKTSFPHFCLLFFPKDVISNSSDTNM